MRLFLSFLFFSMSSHFAIGESKISYRQDQGGIYLSSDDCSSVARELSSLIKWSQNSYVKRDCNKKPIQTATQCKVDVGSCLPPLVVKNYLKPYASDIQGDEDESPNCFGLVLFTTGFSPALNFATDDELYGYLRAPLCTPVAQGQTPKPGDIGILSKEGQTSHAFIYVSPQTVWDKSGYGRTQLPSMKDKQNMLISQQYGGECEVCKNIDANHRLFADCSFCLAPFETHYFHCENVETALRKSRGELEKGLQQKMVELDQLTCQTSPLFFENGALTQLSAKNLNETLLMLAQYFHAENQRQPIKNPPESNRDWQLSLMSLRLQSLQIHLESARNVAGDENYQDRAFKINGHLAK